MNNSPCLAVILIDHGSKIDASNQLLQEVADLFRQTSDFEIVEAAHMELAEPDLLTAFARCVQRGAEKIVVHPYFLGPGRHVREDIPRLAAAAAAANDDVSYTVTEPLGLHSSITGVIGDRIQDALHRETDQAAD